MKKYISVFGLFARSSFYKVLIILGLLTAWELGRGACLFAQEGLEPAQTLVSITDIIRPATFYGSLILAFWLVFSPSEKTGDGAMLLNRLRLSRTEVFRVQTAYCGCVYVLFWAWQLAMLLILLGWYQKEFLGDWEASQFVYLFFTRQDVIHGLLPMGSWMRLAFSLLAVLDLSLVAAGTARVVRAGRVPVLFLIFGQFVSIRMFLAGSGTMDLLLNVVVTAAIWGYVRATPPRDEEKMMEGRG